MEMKKRKTVHLVGMGMGAGDLTRAGLEAIASAEVLFGAPRLLALSQAVDGISLPADGLFPLYKPEDVLRELERSKKSRFAVLVSGDAGFFSGATALLAALRGFDVHIVPGISCASALAARLGVPWHDCKFVSLHGAEANIADLVRRHRRVICLTDGNVAEIGRRLIAAGLEAVHVCLAEKLGSPEEKITEMTVRELLSTDATPLATLLITNENFDSRVRFGLPDEAFVRIDGVPMTKSEVRAVIAAGLNLPPGAICYDVGAGTGSVSVEMALAAYEGHVFAVERSAKALKLAEENLLRFQIGNATLISGEAPDAFADLPTPDAAFIGGTQGEMRRIIEALVDKNANVRIVASAITLENALAALAALESAFTNVQLLQLSVSRAECTAPQPHPLSTVAAGENGWMQGSFAEGERRRPHRMKALNPVFILSGGGAS